LHLEDGCLAAVAHRKSTLTCRPRPRPN